MQDFNKKKYDIFISYTHVDNKQLSREHEGWISCFHNALQIRLTQLLGYKANIWRDKKLQGNDYFSDEIESTIMHVKIILSIISPGYKIKMVSERITKIL